MSERKLSSESCCYFTDGETGSEKLKNLLMVTQHSGCGMSISLICQPTDKINTMIAAKVYWALLIWQALLTWTFHGSFHVILTTNSWCGYYYHSHFTDEVTEAQNSQVTQSRWPVGEGWSEHSNLGSWLAEPVLITSILLKAILKRK